MTEAFAAVAALVRDSTARIVDGRGRGAGACIVWGDRRTVVTSAHVVRGLRAAVQFRDGSWFEARIKERDEQVDLAVLRLPDVAPAPPCAVGDSATLRTGEFVFAVGDPLGLAGAISTGIVQRRGARFVVADLCLLPGNSGGPLADARGGVVGINSMVANGLALAIPSEVVRSFLRAAGTLAA